MAEHAIARVAVWNLAGFSFDGTGIDPNSDKAMRQAEGIALLDADLVALVEVSPLSHIDRLAELLKAEFGVSYNRTILEQPDSPLNIGFLHKPDMEVDNPRFIPGSQGDYDGGRMALAVDAKMGKFKAILVGVHLKSGRDKSEQDTRDTQCKVIGDWLSTVRDTSPYGHHTLVLLGDFNMIPGQDVSNFHHLGGDDVMDFVSCWICRIGSRISLTAGGPISWTGLRCRGRSRATMCAAHCGCFRCIGRWTPTAPTRAWAESAFKDEVSDHLPFVASFPYFLTRPFLRNGACALGIRNSHKSPLPERWPSGRRRTPGKCVGGKPSPGFESLSLRHLLPQRVAATFSTCAGGRRFSA